MGDQLLRGIGRARDDRKREDSEGDPNGKRQHPHGGDYSVAPTPARVTSVWTRLRISSRMARTRFERLTGRILERPVVACTPGTTGHSSPQPIVINREACSASAGVSSCGTAAATSMPASRIASTTTGFTRSAGCVPAETARAFEGSASALKNAAAICDRPALCTQAKTTVITACSSRCRSRVEALAWWRARTRWRTARRQCHRRASAPDRRR